MSDWGRRVITVVRSLAVIRAELAEGPTKTRQRRERHHRPGRGGAALVGAKLVKDPLCLVAFFRRLLPCLPDGLTLAYARLAKRLVIVTHFHELRHFSATTAMAAARRGDGSRPARHADPALTLRVYAHALKAR